MNRTKPCTISVCGFSTEIIKKLIGAVCKVVLTSGTAQMTKC